jgi:hypothetical protein
VIIKRHTDPKVSDDVFNAFRFSIYHFQKILCISPGIFSSGSKVLSGLYPEVLYREKLIFEWPSEQFLC